MLTDFGQLATEQENRITARLLLLY